MKEHRSYTARKRKGGGARKQNVLDTCDVSYTQRLLLKYKKPYVSYSNCPLHPFSQKKG